MNISPRDLSVLREISSRYRTNGHDPDALRRKVRSEGIEKVETPERIKNRMALAESVGDELLEERIMGKTDFLPVNFLARGAAAARSVCRIDVFDSFGRLIMKGSGFLVGSDLLMTNHHVLQSKGDAAYAIAVFDDEADPGGQPCVQHRFKLDPGRLFCNDKALDYALVAVSPTSVEGKPLKAYGFNRLMGESGKALLTEHVNIIQHPMGLPKQVALRDNDLTEVGDHFLHYETDSEHGSSGSPVFNDLWLVIALHHSAYARMDGQGRFLDKQTHQPIAGDPRAEDLDYLGNEGVRVSSIYEHLKTRPDLGSDQRALALSIFKTVGEVCEAPDAGLVHGVEPTVHDGVDLVERLRPAAYAGCEGYDEDFLGLRVPLPVIAEEQRGDIAPVKGADDGVLEYRHFSIVMSRSRKVAFFTACNIDGKESRKIQRTKDKWYIDGRVDESCQTNGDLYAGNDLDRGHLVRREDPCWGEEAEGANEDTFHYTNCSPQHKDLNQKTWLGLENFVLDNARAKGIKVTVMQGPVFRDDDLEYRGVLIPAEFWKIVVTNDGGQLAASAYLQSQRAMLGTLEFAYGEYKTYNVPIARIEKLTGLDFGPLSEADRLAGGDGGELEAMRVRVREVVDPALETL